MRVITRTAAVLAAVLTFACTLVGVPVALAVPSAASTLTPDLALTAVTPSIATPGKPVTLTGTLTAGETALTTPVLSAALSSTDLDTTASVQAWNAGTSSLPTRTRVAAKLGALGPGDSEPFTLVVPASALTLGYSNANLPLSISLADRAGAAPMRTWRTTLSFIKSIPKIPLHLTWLVPLTLPADAALFGPTGAARDAAWARAIGPGSRIDSMLSALSGLPVTWVIDPAVVAPTVAADPDVPAPQKTSTSTSGSSSTTTPSDSSSTSGSSSTTPSDSSSTSGSSSTTPSDSSTASGSSSTGGATSGAMGGTADPGSTSSDPGSTSPGARTSSASTTSVPPDPGTSIPTGPDGTANTPLADVLADQLRARLRTLPVDQSVLWTPYADPDLSALATSGADGRKLLDAGVGRALPPDMAAVSTTRVAWPVAPVNAAAARTITSAWSGAHQPAPVLVLPQEAAADYRGITTSAERAATGTSGLLLYNQTLSTLAGASSGDPGLRAQQFLARTLAVYEEQPATKRSLVIALPRTGGATPAQLASVISTAHSAPWLADRTGSQAVQIARASPTDRVRSARTTVRFPAPGTTAVTSAMLGEVSTQQRQLSGVNALLVDSEDVISDRVRIVANIVSTRWRGHPAGAADTARHSGSALTAILAQVSVNPSPVNFFTDRDDLAIAVVNTLNRPVHNVQVLLEPRNLVLKVRRQAAPVALTANGRGIVRPSVAAAGSGTVAVDVVLQTSNGVALGTPPRAQANLQVNVRPTATWIYWVLGAVAALILIAGVIRSVRRGPREADAPDPHTGDAAPGSTPPTEVIVAGTHSSHGPSERSEPAEDTDIEDTQDDTNGSGTGDAHE